MEAQQEAFRFGPHILKTFPQNSSLTFQTNHPLRPAHKCLVDNLWINRNTTQFHQILDAISGHLVHLGLTAERAITPMQRLTLNPQQLLSQSKHQGKRIKKLQKENRRMRKRMKELQKENEKMKKEMEELKTELINKEEKKDKMIVLPEFPEGIKEKILKELSHAKMINMSYIQDLFKIMIKDHTKIPDGLTFTMMNYQSHGHDPNTYKCNCDTGFTFIQAFLDLDNWVDQDIQGIHITASSLLEMGFLQGFIISKPKGAREFYKNQWRLFYVIAETLNCRNISYIQATIRSTPQSFNSGYPDETRNEILIEPHNIPFKKPVLFPPHTEAFIMKGNSIDHLNQARSYLKAYEEKDSYIHHHSLLTEDRTLRIYQYQNLGIQVPWLSHIDENVALTHHFIKSYADQELTLFGPTTSLPPLDSDPSEGNYDRWH